jgi:hypothetical protein
MAATKSAPSEISPTRRAVLALLGGWVLARIASPGRAEAKPERADFAIRDGWILRPDDIERMGLA